MDAKRVSLTVLVCAAIGLFGCGSPASSPNEPVAAETQGAAFCPTTLALMNGRACSHEALECTVEFPCGAVEQQARCTCTGGRFLCEDEVAAIAPGSSPQCVKNAKAEDSACPRRMSDAQGLECTGTGRSCFYEGAKCDDGVTRLDSCECRSDPYGVFRYACTVVPCSPGMQANP